jgi:phosphoenolpyruvate synthase/pyruvate phosphate dikinase
MMIVRGPKGIKETVVPEVERKKQKITDAQIIKLATICDKIEKHYKKPQDIEWAIEKGKIYIVQSRPITTL